MSRHERRRFRREVSSTGLLTSLVQTNDPRLREVPIFFRAVRWWVSCLPGARPPRGCVLCKRSLWCEQDVGLVLLSMSATPTTAVACAGLCFGCHRDADWMRIEAACTIALQTAVPNGNFERLVLQ